MRVEGVHHATLFSVGLLLRESSPSPHHSVLCCPSRGADGHCLVSQILVTPDLYAPCLPGYFKEDTLPRPCDPCLPGTYQDKSSSSNCSICPPHSNTSGLFASDELTDCVCDVAYTGPNGGPCLPCAPGTFKNITGSSECMLCTEGETYQDAPASTSCKPCDPTERCADGLYWATCPRHTNGICAQCTNYKPQGAR